MIRLFVFDMDGTALPYGNTSLSPRVAEGLRALAGNGVRLAVASGRGPESLNLLLKPLEVPIYVIAHDGAVAYENGRAVYRRPIAPETVRSFCRLPQNRGRTLLLYGEGVTYIRRGSGDREALSDTDAPLTELAGEYAIRTPVYKVAAYGPSPEKPLPVDPSLRRTYRVDTAEEYVCAFTNKGTALSDLQIRMAATVFDTAAAGDGRADLPLFSRAALTFAPADAPHEIRDAAKITGDFSDFLSALVKTTQKQP